MTGEMPMELLAVMLRPIVGRPIVDKTGLAGSYRVRLQFGKGSP